MSKRKTDEIILSDDECHLPKKPRIEPKLNVIDLTQNENSEQTIIINEEENNAQSAHITYNIEGLTIHSKQAQKIADYILNSKPNKIFIKNCLFKDSNFELIANAIQQYENIETMIIEGNNHKLLNQQENNEGFRPTNFETLFKSLENHKNLKYLSLDLKGLNEKGISYFTKLSTLKSIESLTIANCYVSMHGLNDLIKQISNLTNLRELNFESVNFRSKKNINIFSNALNKLPNLKIVKLNNCEVTSIESLENLVCAISFSYFLKNFEIQGIIIKQQLFTEFNNHQSLFEKKLNKLKLNKKFTINYSDQPIPKISISREEISLFQQHFPNINVPTKPSESLLIQENAIQENNNALPELPIIPDEMANLVQLLMSDNGELYQQLITSNETSFRSQHNENDSENFRQSNSNAQGQINNYRN